MRAIQSTSWGQPPSFTSSAPSPPSPAVDEIQLKVLASGLHRLVRAQALGNHYSARNLGLPYTPGADGVGESSDGKRYYFTVVATGGGFAETINVPRRVCFELAPGSDPVQVAALMNPGMSSWLSLTTRVKGLDLSKGFSVAILGVTALSGRVAVHFARRLGATRVVGIARNEKKLKAIPDLDERIVLKDPVEDTKFERVGNVQVVIDYLWGPPMVAFLNQLKADEVQWVQTGSMASPEASIPSNLFRSKNITMRGSGPGAWKMDEYTAQLKDMLAAVEALPKQDVKVRRLEEVEEAWKDEADRTVFVP